jgi:hypothetical protein
MNPLAIDLFCGLGGWTDGLLAEGWDVIGFDIERHHYGDAKYPAQLVLQDVLTLHGKQFKDAALIVASPPCQEYSYMAMPWSIAKKKQREYLDGTRDVKQLTALFDACFRIQREAIEAAGHFIPLIVENVRGAQKWVGRSRWNFGSFHLWGDVPALMPMTSARRMKSKISCAPRLFSERIATTEEEAHALHYRLPDGQKTTGHINIRNGHTHTLHLTNQMESEGVKQAGIHGMRNNGKGDRWFQDGAAKSGSKSNARKAASAAIAKIPLPLARYIASFYRPIA